MAPAQEEKFAHQRRTGDPEVFESLESLLTDSKSNYDLIAHD